MDSYNDIIVNITNQHEKSIAKIIKYTKLLEEIEIIENSLNEDINKKKIYLETLKQNLNDINGFCTI